MAERRMQIEEIEGVTVARWDDRPQWPEEGDALFRLAESKSPRRVLINFGQVDSLASMVLAKLLSLNKKLQAGGGTLSLCGVSKRVQEVFDVTRVSDFFDFHASEQDALQALASGSPSAKT